MIAKVYGKANGEEIAFSHIRGDLWQAEVPSNKRGEWFCTIYAENEAGKVAFVSKRLLAVSGHKVRISLVPRRYTIALDPQSYSIRLIGRGALA